MKHKSLIELDLMAQLNLHVQIIAYWCISWSREAHIKSTERFTFVLSINVEDHQVRESRDCQGRCQGKCKRSVKKKKKKEMPLGRWWTHGVFILPNVIAWRGRWWSSRWVEPAT